MSGAYFSLILREYGSAPDARSALLDGTSVSEPAPAEITLGQQLRQVRNACRVLQPGWSLSMGSRLHAATHGPLGVAAVSAPTMREGLDVMTRFSQVRAPHFRLRALQRGGEVWLLPEDRVALQEDEQRALLDIVLLSTQGMIESILGRPMREARIELPHPAPQHADRYAAFFHGSLHFACREPAIVIPSDWLLLACPLSDPLLYDASLRSLRSHAQRVSGGRLLLARLEQLLAADGATLGARPAARALGMSARTLNRRLRDEGTSFEMLREAARKAQAESLLRDPELSVADVACALGYEDAANFGRAFRRWFGVSPGRHRQQQESSGDGSGTL
jgi:AraC-like DNA-binding protein